MLEEIIIISNFCSLFVSHADKLLGIKPAFLEFQIQVHHIFVTKLASKDVFYCNYILFVDDNSLHN